MIHFVLKYLPSAGHNPLEAELRRMGVPHRVFAREVNQKYRNRLALLFRVYPTLIWVGLCTAVRSLLLSRPAPQAVILTSDIDALIFGVLSRLFMRPTHIVFETFIATPREKPFARALHQRYYRFVLGFVDLAICHSPIEVDRYATLFAGVRARFAYLPYGTSVPDREALRARFSEEAAASTVIVAAGRSGRDYRTLAEAVRGLPCTLRIICDWQRPTQDVTETEQVTILRSCFGMDYLEELARARCVVVPLSVEDISAGQMVMLKSFALAKAVIATETATTPEYAEDGRDALMVRIGDVADMRAKIVRLLGDGELCRQIGLDAARRFDAEFSTEAYTRKLVAIARGIMPTPRSPRAGRAALHHGYTPIV